MPEDAGVCAVLIVTWLIYETIKETLNFNSSLSGFDNTLSLFICPDWVNGTKGENSCLYCINLHKCLSILRLKAGYFPFCVTVSVLQAKAYQLLMTYSAAYVKLLVSQSLTGPSHHRLRSRRNHCTNAPFCLCQYIKKKILQ